jgi:Rrf2 family protein
MIRLSKKWSYALKSVIYVAKNNELVKITDISHSADISEGMVRRIVADLEKSGILTTVKWRNGGVKLWKKIHEISVYDILYSIWEELWITECTRWEFCDRVDDCSTTSLLWNLQKWFHSLLKLNTLDKIIK